MTSSAGHRGATSHGPRDTPRLYSFATQGQGSGDEARIVALLADFAPTMLTVKRKRKMTSAVRLFARLTRDRPDLVVMEGTGLAGGSALIAARLLAGVPYVVSSGDAVGPYIGIRHPALGPLGNLYERTLCALSAGFIGWSPYLVGRALTYGAPRAMTAAHWAAPARRDARERVRAELGIPSEALVFGLVGSLDWTDPPGYCYGFELVTALKAVSRSDVRVLVIGDGSGLERLRVIAGEDLDERVILPGRIPPALVPDHLAAIDVASLPQSVDQVGAFRYTTKISEYLAAGLPIVTGQIPLAYDLDDGWLWRLRGDAPWDHPYLAALADLMGRLDWDELDLVRQRVPASSPLFDGVRQRQRVRAFISDLLERDRR